MQTTMLIAAGDHAAATAFYDQIGIHLTTSPRRPAPATTYGTVMFQLSAPEAVPTALRGRLLLLVDDIGEALAAAEAAGGSVLVRRTLSAGRAVALVADREGNEIGLTDTPR